MTLFIQIEIFGWILMLLFYIQWKSTSEKEEFSANNDFNFHLFLKQSIASEVLEYSKSYKLF